MDGFYRRLLPSIAVGFYLAFSWCRLWFARPMRPATPRPRAPPPPPSAMPLRPTETSTPPSHGISSDRGPAPAQHANPPAGPTPAMRPPPPAMLQTVATLDLEFRPWVLTGSASLDHGLGAQWSVVASLDLRPKLSGQWSPVKEPPPHGTDSASGHWHLYGPKLERKSAFCGSIGCQNVLDHNERGWL